MNKTLTHRGGTSLSTTRSFGLDLIRAFAIFSVIGNHFFTLNTPFITSPFVGGSMFLQSVSLSIFLSGVPLFLMLTGFLNSNKFISRTYYSGIFKVIISYLFFAILSLLYMRYYLSEDLSLRSSIGKILRFNAVPYGWYIKMWIGLFLLTPFLNVLYKGLPNKRQRQLLIITLASMTFLPDLTNRFGFYIFPDFWKQCFPITYYFIGSYIREYKPKINKIIAFFIIIAIGLFSPLYTVFFNPGYPLTRIMGGAFDIFGAFSAILLYLIMYDVQCSTKWLKKLIYWISLLSLDMYLCCWIFDSMIYPYFINRYFESQTSFGLFFFIIVPTIFFASFALAYIKRIFFSLPIINKYQ